MNEGHGVRAIRALAVILPALVALTPGTGGIAAQQTGTIIGTVVVAEDGRGLAGAYVRVEGERRSATTAEDGTFRIDGVRAGEATLVTDYIGRRVGRRSVTVRAGETVRADFALDVAAVPAGDLVVSVSREVQRRSETPASIGVITGQELREVRPSHPAEIANRIPGVWVNVTGGEGHMTAIRQPKTTNPVYLFLEDGVPTRSTGFFNHNALYEIDVPHAERIEITKGPATALYGGDAIGGMVNVVTRSPADEHGIRGTLEGGAFGFARFLASAATQQGRDGLLGELNFTRTDGWRDGTDYDRQSGTVRWDHTFDANARMRAVATFSRIDQSTAGSSAISRDDYLENPERNYTPISYRRINAARVYASYERLGASTLVTVTPFMRWNRMDILPNWSLTFDPGIWNTGHASAGALLKVRHDYEPMRARLIAGADMDFSPGWHEERRITPTRSNGIFTSYTDGQTMYDYDVAFRGISPYVQAEFSPVAPLRMVAGLRFDYLGYDYDNALGELTTGAHRRPASTSVSYTHASPKLGATFQVAEAINLFAAWSHGFRAPSEGQLFRQGRAVNTLRLETVKADNMEGGIRIRAGSGLTLEATAYRLTKTDDILALTNEDGSTETSNAGETLHRGIEIGAGLLLPAGLRFDAAYSVARHTYEVWQPREGVDFSGNEMEDAPRDLGNAVLSWTAAPLGGSQFSIEYSRIGKYWMDADNTHRYPGHDLINLRASVPAGRVVVFGRLTNLTDERYAESAAWTAARGEEFAPGMPRALYVGVEWR
jgi:outer membrane receptor protein involved in Fe transport